VRIGLMCERDATGHFRRFAARVRERLTIDHGTPASLRPRCKMLPLAPIARTYASRVLAIGDAAGIVKATTGGGIYYSLVSAEAAGEVLASALRSSSLDARTLSRYERAWRARLGPEIDAQLELRELAHRMNDADIEALFELARTDGIMPIVRSTARFNQHRALIRAVFRHPPARRLLFDRLRGRDRRQSHAAGH
jgi:flavin-dependent dehydrogenase